MEEKKDAPSAPIHATWTDEVNHEEALKLEAFFASA